MKRRCLILWILLFSTLAFAGCGGGSDPVNEGKDKPVEKPVPPKKDK